MNFLTVFSETTEPFRKISLFLMKFKISSMKSLFSISIFFLFLICSNAQESTLQPPDYDLIENNVNNKDSQFYYPNLLSRFKTFDKTLTINDYHHLYYGFLFQKEYDPFYQFEKEKELNELLKDEPKPEKIPEIISLINESLQSFPIDLTNLFYLSYLYDSTGNTEMAEKISDSIIALINVISQTGDGKSCETGIHVIMMDDEYFLFDIWGIKSEGQSLINEDKQTCDLLKFKQPDGKEGGVYFEISKMWEKEAEIWNGK